MKPLADDPTGTVLILRQFQPPVTNRTSVRPQAAGRLPCSASISNAARKRGRVFQGSLTCINFGEPCNKQDVGTDMNKVLGRSNDAPYDIEK
ncbi:MAG: hypothetical protein NT123_10050 [Proteobacteria bacterium]|nr:hypothetical protein [Pseudomonadota bacterium]